MGVPPDVGAVGGILLRLVPPQERALEDHAEHGVPDGEGEVGWIEHPGDALHGVEPGRELARGPQEFPVEHAVLALQSDQDEIVVGAEGFPELEVEGRLRLALREEGFEVVVESNL